MRVRFLHHSDAIVHEEANGRRTAPRSLTAEDRQRIGDWLNRYSDILEQGAKTNHSEADLLALGREIADWLDGAERWLSGLLRPGAARPLEIEFVSEDPEQDGASDFLSLPWEIMATAKGFLAADATLGFCPIRRVGIAAPSRPPADDHALTILFLSATPQGESELWVEQEEVAILKSAGRLPLDLVVEDGGTLDDLRERLSLEWPVEVLHLSCHGLAGRDGDPPMLALEDELGVCAPIDPAAFLDALGPDHRPRLLFLSACETAADAAGVDPFILPMMAAGQPAAIGWAGSVYDSNASAFAAALYQRIAGGDRLEAAVASARRALLAPPNGQDRLPHWHLARLFLSGDGGGALCRPRARRRQRPFDHAESRFFGNNRKVPVVGRTGFVGRRREVQRALRVLLDRPRGCAGLLLHGAGHLGKSSLAARIADRMTGHEPAVVYGACDIDEVWKALAVARPGFDDRLGLDPAALRGRPDAIHAAMRRVLEGPLRDEPVLLVLDDFEQCLDLSATGRPTVKVAALPVLDALLRAFAESSGDSALLITCRFRFALAEQLKGTLEDIPLHPFERGTRLKQAASRLRDRKAGDVADDLLDRCLEAARGNPGLQDLLIALALSAPDKAERAVVALDGWLAGTERPDDAECAERLDHLMLDTLWDCIDADGRRLLRAVAGIELPLPLPALSVLAHHVGMADAAFDRLLSLSVFDLFRDVVDADRPAAAPCHLLAPRIAALEPLTEDEGADFTQALLPALFAEWEDDRKRPFEADVVLANLAVRASNTFVLRLVVVRAVHYLIETQQYRWAAELGQQSVALIECAGLSAPLQLLRHAADAAKTTGNIDFARRCLGQAMDRLSEASNHKDLGSIRTDYARLLVREGKIDQAMEIYNENLKLFHKQYEVRERAITLGDIARLKSDHGLVDEALALHEEEVAIYERLGDVRSRAIALGDIARLKAGRGFVEDALVLNEEQLGILGDLGDMRSQAVTLGDIARLKARHGLVNEALTLHEEELAVYERLGDLEGQANSRWSRAMLCLRKTGIGEEEGESAVNDLVFAYETLMKLGLMDGIAVVMFDIAQVLSASGRDEMARDFAERSLKIFTQLRWNDEVSIVLKFLSDLSHD